MEVDSCLTGCGGVSGNEFLCIAPSFHIEGTVAYIQQMINILIAVNLWGPQWKNAVVMFTVTMPQQQQSYNMDVAETRSFCHVPEKSGSYLQNMTLALSPYICQGLKWPQPRALQTTLKTILPLKLRS